jgi:ribonuclease VapC
MSKFVLDSSAILAFLNGEKGGENLEPYLYSGAVSSVNVAEVLSKLIENGHTSSTAQEALGLLQLNVVNLDYEHARVASELRMKTRTHGLSLGDRCCLATAILMKAPAVTADSAWRNLTVCKIETIR